MKKVTSADSIITISHYRNILESEGITAFMRNHNLGSILGEMPFQEVWPELWIENDLDFNRAVELISGVALAAETPAAGWRCADCGNDNEAQFGQCWNCGAGAPDS